MKATPTTPTLVHKLQFGLSLQKVLQSLFIAVDVFLAATAAFPTQPVLAVIADLDIPVVRLYLHHPVV